MKQCEMTADPLDIICLYHYQNHLYSIFLLSGRSRDYHVIYNYCQINFNNGHFAIL